MNLMKIALYCYYLWALLVQISFAHTPVYEGVITPGPQSKTLTIKSQIEARVGEIEVVCPHFVHSSIRVLTKATFAYRGKRIKDTVVLTELWFVSSVEAMNARILKRDGKLARVKNVSSDKDQVVITTKEKENKDENFFVFDDGRKLPKDSIDIRLPLEYVEIEPAVPVTPIASTAPPITPTTPDTDNTSGTPNVSTDIKDASTTQVEDVPKVTAIDQSQNLTPVTSKVIPVFSATATATVCDWYSTQHTSTRSNAERRKSIVEVFIVVSICLLGLFIFMYAMHRICSKNKNVLSTLEND